MSRDTARCRGPKAMPSSAWCRRSTTTPCSSAPIAFGPSARSAIASDHRRGAPAELLRCPTSRGDEASLGVAGATAERRSSPLPPVLHSSGPQRAQGGDDEWHSVGEGNLPEQPSGPMPREQYVALIDGRQERSHRERNQT